MHQLNHGVLFHSHDTWELASISCGDEQVGVDDEQVEVEKLGFLLLLHCQPNAEMNFHSFTNIKRNNESAPTKGKELGLAAPESNTLFWVN